MENGSDEIDFAVLRRKDNGRYRQLCRDASKVIEVPYLEKLALFLIKKEGERYEEEINVLRRWTERFKFFQELNAKASNVTMRIHEKCCARIRYEKIPKGQHVFMAGDIPEKFYIILSGEVNILLQKNQADLELEIKQTEEQLKKLAFKDRAISVSFRVDRMLQKREFLMNYSQSIHYNSKHGSTQLDYKPDIQSHEHQSQQSSQQPKQCKMIMQGLNSPKILAMQQKNSPRMIALQNSNSPRVQGMELSLGSPSRYQPIEALNSPRNQEFIPNFPLNQLSQQFSPSKQDNCNSILGFSLKQSLPQKPQISVTLDEKSVVSPLNFSLVESKGMNSDLLKNSSPSNILNNYQKSDQQFNELKLLPLRNSLLSNANHEDSTIKTRKNSSSKGTSEMGFTELMEYNPDEKDIENDSVFIGMGKIRLSDIKEPQRFIQEGVLKHKYLLTQGQGQMFGELGLMMKKPRAATIIAKEDTEFAILEAADFISILQASEIRRFNRRVLFFSQSLLQNCGREVVVKFSYNFEKMKFQKGQFIYHQDHQPEFVYLVKKGTIQISKRIRVDESNESVFDYGFVNPNSQGKKLLPHIKKPKCFMILSISEFSVGQSFGEVEIMQECQRNTSALCISQTATVYALSKQNFLALLQEKKFLVQDFESQVSLKESFKNQKIAKFFDTLSIQNKKNQRYLNQIDRVSIVNKKFTREKTNPSLCDFISKPSHPELILTKPMTILDQNPQFQKNSMSQSLVETKPPKPRKEIEVDDNIFENSAFAQFVCSMTKSKQQKLQELRKRYPNIDYGADIFASLQQCKQIKNEMNRQYSRRQHHNHHPRSDKDYSYVSSSSLESKSRWSFQRSFQGSQLQTDEIINSDREIRTKQSKEKSNDSLEKSSSLCKYQTSSSYHLNGKQQNNQPQQQGRYFLGKYRASGISDTMKQEFFSNTLQKEKLLQVTRHERLNNLQHSFVSSTSLSVSPCNSPRENLLTSPFLKSPEEPLTLKSSFSPISDYYVQSNYSNSRRHATVQDYSPYEKRKTNMNDMQKKLNKPPVLSLINIGSEPSNRSNSLLQQQSQEQSQHKDQQESIIKCFDNERSQNREHIQDKKQIRRTNKVEIDQQSIDAKDSFEIQRISSSFHTYINVGQNNLNNKSKDSTIQCTSKHHLFRQKPSKHFLLDRYVSPKIKHS